MRFIEFITPINILKLGLLISFFVIVVNAILFIYWLFSSLNRTNSFRKNSTIEDEIKILEDEESTNYNSKGKYNHMTYRKYVEIVSASIIIGVLLFNTTYIFVLGNQVNFFLWIISLAIQVLIYITFSKIIILRNMKKEKSIWLSNKEPKNTKDSEAIKESEE